MKALRNVLTVVAAAGILSSCQWALMESRLVDRVTGKSDEQRIVDAKVSLGGVIEYTAANGKKFYIQRCRVSAERKIGPLFVFGEIDKVHFTMGGNGTNIPLNPVESLVVIGYDDLVFSGITPPAPEYRHPMGETTRLWEEWEAEAASLKDPGLRLVASTVLPVSADGDNDYVAACISKSMARPVGAASRYLLAPLAAVADVPLTIMGTAVYFPYYNVKYWFTGADN